MERQFETEIEKLKNRVLKMCSLVDEQLESAIRSIEEDNMELAKQVLVLDEKVDKFDVKIDKICQRLLALRQPVATDLRFIMSALTINSNLERIGDLSVNIAENFILMKKKPSFMLTTNFTPMANIVREMIRNSIDSFINNDPKLAQKVIETDKVLDQYNVDNHQILINIMKENKDDIEAAVALLVICRQLERLGDHATNIAEDVYFIVEAQMIKHKYVKYLFGEIGESDKDEDKD
jgi:phosphate transport system protein